MALTPEQLAEIQRLKALMQQPATDTQRKYQAYYNAEQAAKKKADGGRMSKGGTTVDEMRKAIAKASGSNPPMASKSLVGLQDFHTSLSDNIRQLAAEKQEMIESTPFKYDVGHHVFTDHSARLNLPPMKILRRVLVGNDPIREGGVGSKVVKNPETGKAMRTPYEPGYHVYHNRGEKYGGEQEFRIPESAIKGRVKMADGGSMDLDAMRLALMKKAKPKAKKVEVRPTVFDDAASRRNPKIEAAAQALAEGKMKQAAYAKLVAKEKPVKAYDFIPKPATDEQAMDVLLDRQKQNWRSHENWPAGHRVGLRLDIPAYERHGVWVNSVHDESGGKDKFPTSYGPVSSVRNAEFQGNPHKGIKVATGEQSKAPFAKIMGNLEHIDEDQAVKHMQKYLNHPDYRQVGYDPRRHGDFYDRETMQPITHSEHVVQIGPLVLAKKPVYGKRTMYKDGSRVDVMDAYKDPKSTKIADWKWRKMKDVRKDMPITEIPDYIQRGYGEFMNEQGERAKAGDLNSRDLLKAFTITQSSIGRGGLPHSTATKTGMKLPNTGGEVRPEGAFAEWLGSPMGQRFLDMAVRGEIDPKVLRDIQEKFSPFGKQNQLTDQMTYAAQNMPEMAKRMNKAVTGSTDEYRDWAEQMKGVAGAKSGFVGSMIGRGDLPTLDARQLNLHSLPANVGIGSIMNRGKGKGAREAVDRLSARQKAMNLKIDPSLAQHYQHLAHHAVWDKVGDNKTTHDDIIKAMRGYAEGGVTHAHHLDIEERPL